MHNNKLFRPSVGADLSRTPPIYRPPVGIPLSGLFFETALSAPKRINRSRLTGVTLSRSEGSLALSVEKLHRAQHDNVRLSP